MHENSEAAFLAKITQLVDQARIVAEAWGGTPAQRRDRTRQFYQYARGRAQLLATALPGTFSCRDEAITDGGERGFVLQWGATQPWRWLHIGLAGGGTSIVLAWELPTSNEDNAVHLVDAPEPAVFDALVVALAEQPTWQTGALPLLPGRPLRAGR